MKNVAYEAVYNQIMSALEKGEIPWKKPWTFADPRNAKTGHRYTGINFFLLTMLGYEDPRWLTYRQLQEMGGTIVKGSKATPIVFWKMLSKENEDGKIKTIPFLRYFNVFNVTQCEGLSLPAIEVEKKIEAEAIIEGYKDKPVIKYGFNQACYIPSIDEVHMPSRSQFESADYYAWAMFHELSHSTGHH